jgi:RND family efflux transporter MFP subunit
VFVKCTYWEYTSPVTDEAYLAALANFKNKDLIAKRAIELQKENLVSIQEKDQAVSDSDIARAQLNAQKVLKTIRAPFDGTITARYADMGALVQNAENSQNSALPIVTLSDINKLIVNVYLDQNDAPYIQKSDPVKIEITIPTMKQILGNINRITNNLDQKTKMMLVEVDIPNKERFLVSGSFVKVYIKVKSQAYYILPVESLIIKKDKSFVALVNNLNKVHFKQIKLENNDGKIIGFHSDVNEGDYVILNPGNELNEGTLIRPIFDQK